MTVWPAMCGPASATFSITRSADLIRIVAWSFGSGSSVSGWSVVAVMVFLTIVPPEPGSTNALNCKNISSCNSTPTGSVPISHIPVEAVNVPWSIIGHVGASSIIVI